MLRNRGYFNGAAVPKAPKSNGEGIDVGYEIHAIADNCNTTRQAVSKHLRILTECELVKQEQQGREIYYSLEIKKMKEIDKWLDQFRKIWETRFNQLDNVLSTIKKQKK